MLTRLSHACPDQTPPCRSNTKTKSLPRSNLSFCHALSIPLHAFLGVVIDCKRHPFINISYDP
ncbi:unnamed protein product [Prunus brigantina]